MCVGGCMCACVCQDPNPGSWFPEFQALHFLPPTDSVPYGEQDSVFLAQLRSFHLLSCKLGGKAGTERRHFQVFKRLPPPLQLRKMLIITVFEHLLHQICRGVGLVRWRLLQAFFDVLEPNKLQAMGTCEWKQGDPHTGGGCGICPWLWDNGD